MNQLLTPTHIFRFLAAARYAPRWTLFHPDGRPYLTRTVVWGCDCLETHDPEAPFSIFLHEIHSADGDRHMHDHPWRWACAMPLSGGYTERRPASREGGPGEIETRYGVGDCNILRPGDYHSIVDVQPGTVTLFLAGRECSDWGFLADGIHVPHAEYFKRLDVQHMTHERIR